MKALNYGIDINDSRGNNNNINKGEREDKKMKTTTTINDLTNEMTNLLEKYNFKYDEEIIKNSVLETWRENKCELIEMFENHPLYNGNYQIVLDESFERERDTSVINNFMYFVNNCLNRPKIDFIKKYDMENDNISFYEYKIYNELKDKLNRATYFNNHPDFYSRKEINNAFDEYYRYKEYVCFEYQRFKKILKNLDMKINTRKQMFNMIFIASMSSSVVDEELINQLLIVQENYAGKYDEFNNIEKKFGLKEGMKISRLVNKLCKIYKIDEEKDYNKQFARFSDAINPLSIKRKFVLSVNPIDYLTMSFGNSWASCHTIDKNNVRRMPNSYEGMYCSGTMSYMLDEVSVVTYSISETYNGNHPELEPKINRNMFHMGLHKGNNFMIQARVYPQDNDGKNTNYKIIREIVERVISQCMRVDNLWVVKNSDDECMSQYCDTEGTHYKDYLYYKSYICFNRTISDMDNEPITIGHDPICICCGEEHDNESNLLCEYCEQNKIDCNNCGYEIDRDDAIEIDGNYYCRDCVTWCEYHNCYEVNSDNIFYDVYDYGTICEDALEDGDFYWCEGYQTYMYAINDSYLNVIDSCGELYTYSESYIDNHAMDFLKEMSIEENEDLRNYMQKNHPYVYEKFCEEYIDEYETEERRDEVEKDNKSVYVETKNIA